MLHYFKRTTPYATGCPENGQFFGILAHA